MVTVAWLEMVVLLFLLFTINEGDDYVDDDTNVDLR